jgi:hypothetical protein
MIGRVIKTEDWAFANRCECCVTSELRYVRESGLIEVYSVCQGRTRKLAASTRRTKQGLELATVGTRPVGDWQRTDDDKVIEGIYTKMWTSLSDFCRTGRGECWTKAGFDNLDYHK